MPKLQILVPHYKEPFAIVKPLLDSLAIQQGVNLAEDVSVIIVNDGPDGTLDTALFEPYPFSISYYINAHEGVSAARNACLDLSSAPFVMFCDCDDMFSSCLALYQIIGEINASTPEAPVDALISTFIQESYSPTTGAFTYANRGNKDVDGLDCIFVHGKIYRRDFLKANNIRWNPALTIHEDSYFNCLCFALSRNTKYLQQPFYLWKYRPNSVCRSDTNYIIKTFPHLLCSSDALTSEFLSRGLEERACYNAYYTLFNTFFSWNLPSWQDPALAPYRDAIVPLIYTYYKKYESLITSASDSVKIESLRILRNKFLNQGLYTESITFADWLAMIEHSAKERVD